MYKSRLVMFFSVLSMLFGGYAQAATATGKVTFAGTAGNGDAYVALNVNIAEPGCSHPRFDVPEISETSKNVLLTAYTAMQLNAYVTVSTVGCYQGMPTLDSSRNSYFYVSSP